VFCFSSKGMMNTMQISLTNSEHPSTVYPKAQNDDWAPFDLMECNASAKDAAALDGKWPNLFASRGLVFPGLFCPLSTNLSL
jgi:hypothetical protein